MGRTTTALTVALLDELPDDVAAHLRWKVDAVTLGRTPAAERRDGVAAWARDVEQQWGSCGRVVLWDDRPVAALLHAPDRFLPGLGEVPTAPTSRDSVAVCSVHVAAEARRGGALRMLVQAVVRDLLERDVRALEAFGARDVRAARCGVTTPVGLWESAGFREVRAHPVVPRMRIDMRGTRAWRDDVERALAAAAHAVRPGGPGTRPAAVPDTRSGTAAGEGSG